MKRGPTLRLVCVNDVYLLDNLPRLRTLVQRSREAPGVDMVLCTMAGDFVAPSLLSSLDHGAGMIDCLNAVPVTHACFGNHEQDVPIESLRARAREFAGTWLNTNMPGFSPSLPPFQVLQVEGPDTRAVRVGLVGVVTEDPSLYRPGPFGGTPMLPANATVLAAARGLTEDEGCACVVALTHQSFERDRALAYAQGADAIPLIVGGHEHEPHIEQHGRAWIVKAGLDAQYAAVVDLAWAPEAPVEGPDLPSVTVRLQALKELDDDPILRARVTRHMAPVYALHAAVLLRLAPGQTLSSVGTRVQQTSVGAMVAARVRDALDADVCLINGGGIRAGATYTEVFTYGDLETELPFANEVVAVTMPGDVLQDVLRASRSKAPRAAPGFLQADDGVRVTADNTLVTVAGAPFDPARTYTVATVRVLFDGMDGIEPLVAYARAHPERIPPRDTGRELKMLVVDAFARALWAELGPFDTLDLDGDDRVTADDLRGAIAAATRAPAQPLLVEGLLRAFDADGDGAISRAEAAAAAVDSTGE